MTGNVMLHGAELSHGSCSTVMVSPLIMHPVETEETVLQLKSVMLGRQAAVVENVK